MNEKNIQEQVQQNNPADTQPSAPLQGQLDKLESITPEGTPVKPATDPITGLPVATPVTPYEEQVEAEGADIAPHNVG